jgi:hypothetical protein
MIMLAEDIDLDTADRGNDVVGAVEAPDRTDTDAQAEKDLADLKQEAVEEKVEEKTDDTPEDKPRNDKGQFEAKIPKSRFDEAVGKERAAREAAEQRLAEAERKLNEREAEQAKSVKFDEMEEAISELEKKHTKLLLDGNEDEAAKVMKQIRHSERQLAAAEGEARAVARVSETLERERLNLVVAQLQADHPVLNDKSEEYDDDITEFVLAKQRTLMNKEGLSPSVALKRAADDVLSRFAKPAEVKEEAKGLDSAAAVTERKQAQVAKNLDTARRQPASLKESGLDSDKAGQTTQLPDAAKMTEAEFSALPETVKARMRGDII